MLFLLKNVKDGSIFYLVNRTEFTVGRRGCDLLIQNDQSISRKHAILRIKDNTVTVEDLESKYKTVFKGKELEAKIQVRLENNDEIQFGVFNSLYRFEQHTFVTTGTRLNNNDKTKLKQELSRIDGQFMDNWCSECTHLTVQEMTLTVKVLHALIDEKPIIIPAFWTKLVENVSKNLPLPKIEDYNKPPIAEPLLNKIDLGYNSLRKSLFIGKVFMFLKEKNKKQMEDVIRKAGGISKSWEKNQMPLDDIINSPKEFLIIQVPDQEEDPSFKELIKLFSKHSKRTIPLQEIAMSILTVSCDKDCNPSFNRPEEVFKRTTPHQPTQNNPLVQNTESEYFSVRECKEENTRMIIPDTLENQLDVVNSVKREEPITKKSEVIDITDDDHMNQSGKRSKNEITSNNPFKKRRIGEENNICGETSRLDKTDFLSKNSSQKRKAEETTDVAETRKENPFAFLNKKVKKDKAKSTEKMNPFAMLKKPTDNVTRVSEENPFKMSSNRNKLEGDLTKNKTKTKAPNIDQIISSTRLNETGFEMSVNYSRINTRDSDTTWFSKKTIDVKENVQSNLDSEMQSYIDMFKDKVVIDVMKILTRSPSDGRSMREVKDLSEGKNFKKFRKIKPLRPQTTIIGKNSFIPMLPGVTTGIAENENSFYNSDEEMEVRRNKKVPKKFCI